MRSNGLGSVKKTADPDPKHTGPDPRVTRMVATISMSDFAKRNFKEIQPKFLKILYFAKFQSSYLSNMTRNFASTNFAKLRQINIIFLKTKINRNSLKFR
jgi:hypothetical protein